MLRQSGIAARKAASQQITGGTPAPPAKPCSVLNRLMDTPVRAAIRRTTVLERGGILRLVVGMAFRGVVLKLLSRILALAAGGGAVFATACMGKPAPPQHPNLRLVSAGISPTHNIHFGDTVHVTARTNTPTTQAKLYLKIPMDDDVHAHVVPLYDDGTHGDSAPGDGEWAADYTWSSGDAAGTVEPLFVAMDFTEGYYESQYEQLKLNVDPGTAAPAANGGSG